MKLADVLALQYPNVYMFLVLTMASVEEAQALYNKMIEHPDKDGYWLSNSLNDGIDELFLWEATPQGDDFWDDVCYEFINANGHCSDDDLQELYQEHINQLEIKQ